MVGVFSKVETMRSVRASQEVHAIIKQQMNCGHQVKRIFDITSMEIDMNDD